MENTDSIPFYKVVQNLCPQKQDAPAKIQDKRGLNKIEEREDMKGGRASSEPGNSNWQQYDASPPGVATKMTLNLRQPMRASNGLEGLG